ncbi:type III secretion system chaperone family protein [Roseiconus lacunae]|uniref:hypothetical protein n=1 Tax=Roseiconus lacunae TaxID=2605694 RepID=UPI001E5CFA09|nr:hypothetical protein [Roseiconus lacunae]MCD0457898.1 hypothetical protein [Roseiconus lacunae]
MNLAEHLSKLASRLRMEPPTADEDGDYRIAFDQQTVRFSPWYSGSLKLSSAIGQGPAEPWQYGQWCQQVLRHAILDFRDARNLVYIQEGRRELIVSRLVAAAEINGLFDEVESFVNGCFRWQSILSLLGPSETRQTSLPMTYLAP